MGQKVLSTILPILTLLASLAAGATPGPFCEIREIASPLVRDRAVQIDFPDGTNIQLVGHTHGNRDSQHTLLETLSNPNITDAAALEVARPIMEKSQVALNFFKSDLEYIRQYVATHRGQAFIWGEGSEQNLPLYTGKTAQALRLHSNPTNGLADAILFSSLSPAFYAKVALPLPTNIEVHGVETIGGLAQSLTAQGDQLEKQARQIMQNNQNTPLPADLNEALKQMIVSWNAALDRGDTAFMMSFSPELFYQAVRNSTASDYQKTALNLYLSSQLLQYQSIALRNEMNSDNLVASHRSGLLFIGSSHVKGMSQILKKKCEAQLALGRTASEIRPSTPSINTVN